MFSIVSRVIFADAEKGAPCLIVRQNVVPLP